MQFGDDAFSLPDEMGLRLPLSGTTALFRTALQTFGRRLCPRSEKSSNGVEQQLPDHLPAIGNARNIGAAMPASAACEFIMDALKTRAPFWKKEETPAGEAG